MYSYAGTYTCIILRHDSKKTNHVLSMVQICVCVPCMNSKSECSSILMGSISKVHATTLQRALGTGSTMYHHLSPLNTNPSSFALLVGKLQQSAEVNRILLTRTRTFFASCLPVTELTDVAAGPTEPSIMGKGRR